MADIIDPSNDVGDLDGLEKSLQEAVTANEQTVKLGPPASEEAKHAVPELPKKYEGKSITQVIEMHRNLESAFGRQANDLGTQRKLTDRLLDLKRSDDLAAAPAIPKMKSEDLLDDPTNTLETYFSAREQRAAEATEQRIATLEAGISRTNFITKHSDYESIANDPKFSAWVQASPLRQRNANAALSGDWIIAGELMDEYKAGGPATAQESNDADLRAAAAAGLSSAGSGSENANIKDKKTYRRADLIRLKLTKPDVYADPEFQKEILSAYAEGRVK